MVRLVSLAIFIAICITTALTLDNGLALTPPMGWLAWERFRCNTDCVNDPDNCISEQLFKQMGDYLVSEGYADVGYNFICLDDCWLARERDENGELQPDPDRFPSGISGLADYMHDLGLLFGIYEDVGDFTCAGYPGLQGNYEKDANTIAGWNVDYLKVDGCNYDAAGLDQAYADFGFYLNQTGRPIVYSCEAPLYQYNSGIETNYTAVSQTCNLWRNYNDVEDSWDSVQSIIDFWGDNQDRFAYVARPGAWNDPDMLLLGNFGLSYDQSKAQMAMWSVFAAPLIMSNDLRSVNVAFKDILQNKAVIAVNQDPLGIQGRRVYKDNGLEYWTRPITPNYGDVYSYAVALLNRRTDGTPWQVTVTLESLGLTEPSGYRVTDLFDNVSYGVVLPTEDFSVSVDPTGVVLLNCEVVATPFVNKE